MLLARLEPHGGASFHGANTNNRRGSILAQQNGVITRERRRDDIDSERSERIVTRLPASSGTL